MGAIKKQLEKLQKKPYEAKIKILWALVAVVSVLTIAVWIVTINARDKIESSNQPIIEELQKNLKQIKDSNPFNQ